MKTEKKIPERSRSVLGRFYCTINGSVLTFHFIDIACPSPLLRNEAGSTPWPDNIWDTADQRRFFGGCNNEIALPYTGCPRRNVRDFGRVFLMLNYTDIAQNTYIQSWTVTEIMAIEKCGLMGCPRTVRRPWRHTRPLCMPGNETPLANIVMQWPWRDNEQLRPV